MNLIIGFILFIASLFLAICLFIFLHELMHYRKLKKYGIGAELQMNFRKRSCCHLNDSEEKKFLKLSYLGKKEILLAGIKSDFLILFFLIVIFAPINILFCFFNTLYINIFILLLIAFEVKSLYANIFYEKSDIEKLIQNSKNSQLQKENEVKE